MELEETDFAKQTDWEMQMLSPGGELRERARYCTQ